MVDACTHDFATLASSVLPGHMRRLEDAMRAAFSLREFSVPRVGVRALLSRHGRREDFSGCYVIMAEHPVYVGISRGVFKRLRQHVTGRTHSDATLAYRMAEEAVNHSTTRAGAMADPEFLAVFQAKRGYLCGLRAAAVEIANPVELVLFEVYAALALGTSTWNTFRTH